MAVITLGDGTGNYGASVSGYTQLAAGNTANDTGTLDTFYIWLDTESGTTKIGTFYTSGSNKESRDYENLGTVASGSEQTFTGKNCDVVSGDYLGAYTTGKLEINTTGGSGRLYASGDKFATSSSFTAAANHKLAIYATGATVAAGSLPLFHKPIKHMIIR